MLEHLGSMGLHGARLGPTLLLATVLYNVQFVPTAVVGAVWPEYFVVVVVLNAGARVVPANERGAAVLCRTWALRG